MTYIFTYREKVVVVMGNGTKRRTFLAAAGAVATGCVGGDDGPDDVETFPLTSSAFNDGEQIPTEYTCDGENVSPPLSVGGAPEEAETLALVVDDPDAPNPPFVHWLLWNVPADVEGIPRDVPQGETVGTLDGARQGANDTDTDEIGYFGPCPPPDDGPHTYRFILYAVDTELELEAGATRGELDAALDGATVAEARLTGTYER